MSKLSHCAILSYTPLRTVLFPVLFLGLNIQFFSAETKSLFLALGMLGLFCFLYFWSEKITRDSVAIFTFGVKASLTAFLFFLFYQF